MPASKEPTEPEIAPPEKKNQAKAWYIIAGVIVFMIIAYYLIGEYKLMVLRKNHRKDGVIYVNYRRP